MTPRPMGGPARRRLLLGACLTIWLAAFVATHLPPRDVPRTGVGDIYLHAAGFFVLGTLLLLTLAAYGAARPRRAAVALLALAIYAALDEATQPLVGRTAAMSDWLADLAGTAAALLLCEAALRLREHKRER